MNNNNKEPPNQKPEVVDSVYKGDVVYITFYDAADKQSASFHISRRDVETLEKRINRYPEEKKGKI